MPSSRITTSCAVCAILAYFIYGCCSSVSPEEERARQSAKAHELIDALWDQCFAEESTHTAAASTGIVTQLCELGPAALPALEDAKVIPIPSHDLDVIDAYMTFQFNIDYTIKEIAETGN